MDEFEHLAGQRGMTADAENYIISKLGTLTFTEISAELGVCVQTIANRAKDFGATERELQIQGHYRYLSMDEVFITRKDGEAVYYWLLNDNSRPWKSNNIRIDVGRGKEDVIKRLLELPHSGDVEAVSIDMWKPYRDAISEALPNAAIVIDPFHVIQHAQKAMEIVRKKADVPASVKSDMKKDARLLLSSPLKLNGEELDRLESYLRAYPDIEKSYFIVQELSGLYRLRDFEDALSYLCDWESEVLKSGVKEMKDILNTVQNWLPYIMNYFIHRITNGRTEGKNHLLRVIDSMGFHYGLDSIQACIYSHDRKQEYLKWQKHMRKRANPHIAA
jgi:transposase